MLSIRKVLHGVKAPLFLALSIFPVLGCAYPAQVLTPTPIAPSATFAKEVEPPSLGEVERQGREGPGVERVLLISIDGLRPDALLLADAPYLASLWRNGAYSWLAQTILPSVTLPAHASMLSGLDVEQHGVGWNDWEPERGFIGVPTVFSLAKEAGLSTAMFVGKAKLRHLAPPGAVDVFEHAGYSAPSIAARAASFLNESRPNLLFVHFPDPDSAGHLYGWMSPQQLEAVARVDEAIGGLLEALEQGDMMATTLIIVTADHGGHGRGHGSADPQDTTIPWIASGPGIKAGYEMEGGIQVYDTAATVLYALALPTPSHFQGRAVCEVFAVPFILCGG